MEAVSFKLPANVVAEVDALGATVSRGRSQLFRHCLIRRSHRLSVTDFDIELLVIAVQAARTGNSSGRDLPGLDAGASLVRRWLKHHSEG